MLVFRPHNVYGEHQNIGDRYRNVIGIFMNQIMEGQPLTIFGDGLQSRAFTYIDDVAPPSQVIDIRMPTTKFLILGPIFLMRSTILQTSDEAMASAGEVIHLAPRNEVLHAYSDHSRVRPVFGNRPRPSLEVGVQRMAAWAKTVGALRSKNFEGIEILKNLPAIWLEPVL